VLERGHHSMCNRLVRWSKQWQPLVILISDLFIVPDIAAAVISVRPSKTRVDSNNSKQLSRCKTKDVKTAEKTTTTAARLSYFVGDVILAGCQRIELVVNHETNENGEKTSDNWRLLQQTTSTTDCNEWKQARTLSESCHTLHWYRPGQLRGNKTRYDYTRHRWVDDAWHTLQAITEMIFTANALISAKHPQTKRNINNHQQHKNLNNHARELWCKLSQTTLKPSLAAFYAILPGNGLGLLYSFQDQHVATLHR